MAIMLMAPGQKYLAEGFEGLAYVSAEWYGAQDWKLYASVLMEDGTTEPVDVHSSDYTVLRTVGGPSGLQAYQVVADMGHGARAMVFGTWSRYVEDVQPEVWVDFGDIGLRINGHHPILIENLGAGVLVSVLDMAESPHMSPRITHRGPTLWGRDSDGDIEVTW